MRRRARIVRRIARVHRLERDVGVLLAARPGWFDPVAGVIEHARARAAVQLHDARVRVPR